jgi:hypothetical protein
MVAAASAEELGFQQVSRPPKAAGAFALDKPRRSVFFISAYLPPALARMHDAGDKRRYNASRLPY